MMQRRFRLTEDSDIKRVRQEGRSWAHPLLVLYASRGGSEATHVGIAVGRRIGDAVTRNRVKRRIRELLRRRLSEICEGWDLLFIARAGAAQAAYAQLGSAVEQLLRRAGLLVTAPRVGAEPENPA